MYRYTYYSNMRERKQRTEHFFRTGRKLKKDGVTGWGQNCPISFKEKGNWQTKSTFRLVVAFTYKQKVRYGINNKYNGINTVVVKFIKSYDKI